MDRLLSVYVFAGHRVQLLWPAPLTLPNGQRLQDEAPLTFINDPAVHNTQVDARPSEYRPAGHKEMCPSTHQLPDGHAEQIEEPDMFE